MEGLLLLLMGITLTSATLQCDYKGYKDVRVQTQDNMEWLNHFVDAWFQTNKRYFREQLQDVIDTNINTTLPSWMVSIKLRKLGFLTGEGPAITTIRSEQDFVKCFDEMDNFIDLRRITFDIYIAFHSTRSIVDVSVELPLGVTADVSLNKVSLLAQARVEVLLSTGAQFPGIVSATFSFTDRPQSKFNVDMYNIIGLDNFGLDTWINDMIESLIQKEMVYPAMLFVDLQGLSIGLPVQTHLISAQHNDFTAAPAAYSVNITIVKQKGVKESEFESEVENIGEGKVRVHRFEKTGTFKYNNLLKSLEHPYVDITIKQDVRFSKDPVAAYKRVDIRTILDQPRMNKTYYFFYTTNAESWKITIDFWAYLLPAVLVAQQGNEVVLYPTFFSQATCNSGTHSECPNAGVLYVQIHRGANMSNGNTEDVDPFVKVYMHNATEKAIFEGKKVSTNNPLFDDRFEVELQINNDMNPELYKNGPTRKNPPKHISYQPTALLQIIRFDVWDHNKFTKNALIGSSFLQPSHEPIINRELKLMSGNKEHGSLFVSAVFRPVPFFSTPM